MIAAWATWSDYGLAVHSGGTSQTVPREPMPDWRYQTRLIGLPGGRALLLSGDHIGSTLDVSVAGGPFGLVAGWPERLAVLAPERIRIGADGVVAGLDLHNREVIVWSPPGPATVHRLPDGFAADDVAATPSSTVICGSVPADKLRSVTDRPAFAEKTDDGWRIDDKEHGGLSHAWRRNDRYDRVYRSGGNLVLTSSYGDLGDETTWIMWRDARGHWTHESLGDDIPRAVLPDGDGGVQVVTHFGRLLTANGRGGWKSRRTLAERVRRLAEPPAGSRIEILDAAYANRELLLLATIRVGTDRWGEAIVAGDELVAVHNGPEAVAVAWLEPA